MDKPAVNFTRLLLLCLSLCGAAISARSADASTEDSIFNTEKILDESTLETKTLQDWHTDKATGSTRQKLIEIKVADNRHARHQQTRIALLSRVTDEGFENGAARAAARQQERQACEAEFRSRVSRHQPSNQRIGEAAVGGDRIDLRPNPLSHRSMHLPLGEYGLGCRLHTSGQ